MWTQILLQEPLKNHKKLEVEHMTKFVIPKMESKYILAATSSVRQCGLGKENKVPGFGMRKS